jgi:hypothetical protein
MSSQKRFLLTNFHGTQKSFCLISRKYFRSGRAKAESACPLLQPRGRAGQWNQRREPCHLQVAFHCLTFDMWFHYSYTVTRPYPDRMAPDQTARGGEYFFSRPCWYFTFLHAARHFRNFPEIYPAKKERV